MFCLLFFSLQIIVPDGQKKRKKKISLNKKKMTFLDLFLYQVLHNNFLRRELLVIFKKQHSLRAFQRGIAQVF